ncbi:ATP-binding cassette domain-containing protein [Arthrobacter sp. ATA002]|uniref:ATP-binding cassette domain-containing protein n=1 Tax=Arthrobacter sp. ATA002 TaxID=2991715 RepID=UPI002E2ED167|nr:ATP-binding cassette domain-containing protein [Arthrobacter sp. ATA002]
MITVTDLRKVYRQGDRDVTALDGVSLSVPKGSIHGIIGHSGAGKSTLVRCLTLLDRPTSGSVTIDGRELTAVRDSEIRSARRRIGMVFQHANLMDSRTAAANIAHPLELAGAKKQAIQDKVSALLRLVGLESFAGAYPRSCPADRNSVWALPGPWPRTRTSCCATSRPRPWIRPPPTTSWI